MFTKIEHFEKAWSGHAAATQRLLDALTDVSLSQKVADEHRTLDRVAWHIVTSIPEVASHTELKVSAVGPEAPVPKTAAEITKAYRDVSGELIDQVKANWDDNALEVVDEMYGEKWARGFTLKILMDHEIHHRGQMTVLMRQAGLKVPGIYGPAKEEWGQYNMPEPEI